MKKITTLILLSIITLVVIPFMSPQLNAQGWTQGQEAVSGSNTGLPETPAADVVMNILKWLLGLVFVLAVLALVGSGIIYVMSFGNSNLTTMAKDWITFAIIGLTISILGFVIVLTISKILTGESIGGGTAGGGFNGGGSSNGGGTTWSNPDNGTTWSY